MSDKVTLGKVLSDLLERRGWTPAQLARVSGVTYSTVSSIINRNQKSTKDRETAVKLAAAFGSEGDVIFEVTGYSKPYPKPVEEMTPHEMIREGLRRLEEEERKRKEGGK